MLKKICEAAEFKLHEEGNGSFSGYASTFGGADRVGDVIAKGAFSKSLEQFKQEGFIAVGHDWAGLPVATVTEAYEDEKGLFIQCDFHSTEDAQDARTVVKERLDRGKSVGLSIGFEIKEADRTKAGRLIREIELFETSIVCLPCNPLANATGAKAADEPADEPEQNSETPPAGVSLADQFDAALAAVSDVIDRMAEVKDLREQEGRSVSEERRAQLADLIAKAQALHEAARARIDDATLLRLKAEHLARVARAREAMLPA